jgi:hypothetical protein
VVEGLPSKCAALSPNSSADKKIKIKNNKKSLLEMASLVEAVTDVEVSINPCLVEMQHFQMGFLLQDLA